MVHPRAEFQPVLTMLRFLISAGLACAAIIAGVTYVSHPAPSSETLEAPPTKGPPQKDGAPADKDEFNAEHPGAVTRLLINASLDADENPTQSELARLLAKRNPHQAMQWASAMAAAEERETLMSDICLTWAETNPLQALAMIDSKLTTSRPNTLASVIAMWASKDLSSASRWVLAQPRDHVRNELVQRLAIKQAELQPRQAAKLVLEEIPGGETQSEAIISVLHQWALRDAVSAKAWIELFPAGPTKERAIRELTNLTAHR